MSRRCPGDLALEVVGHALRAVVVADREPSGGALGDVAEVFHDALADRLERLVPGAASGCVDACALRRAAIDGDE